jgi:hypothetical protein
MSEEEASVKKKRTGRPRKLRSAGHVPPVRPTITPWDAINERVVEIQLAEELVKEYMAHGLDLFLCQDLRDAILGIPKGVQIPPEVFANGGAGLKMLLRAIKFKHRPKPMSAENGINEIVFNATQISGDPARNTIAGVEKRVRLTKKYAKALERYRNSLYSTKRGSLGRKVRKLSAEEILLEAEHYSSDETDFRRMLGRFIHIELKTVSGQKFPASFRSEFSDKVVPDFTVGTLRARAMDLITLDPLDEGKMTSDSVSNRRLERARKCLCQE